MLTSMRCCSRNLRRLNMTKWNVLTACLIIFLLTGCQTSLQSSPSINTGLAAEKPAPPVQLYTAYNIWVIRHPNFKVINYKHMNDVLPAGTEVKNVIIDKADDDRWHFISFQTVQDNKKHTIYFVNPWHPGKTIQDYREYMFTTKNFEELTEGLTEEEIKSIKNAKVTKGMTKRAVLITYGYPPEHHTPTLDSNVWKYWQNRFITFDVCFDDKDLTTSCF